MMMKNLANCLPMRRRKLGGFTIIELMIAVAVIGVLSAIAIPSFRGFIFDSRRASLANDLLYAAQLARNEALKRGQVVTVCSSTNQTSCAGNTAGWNTGWLVFVDFNGDGDIDAGTPPDTILRVMRNDTRSHSVISNRNAFNFPAFNKTATTGSMAVCDNRGASHAKAVVVSATGRTRVVAGPNSLTCPT